MHSNNPEPRIHIPLSWPDVAVDSVALAAILKQAGPWEGIVAIARGGLVPATLLSRALGIRRIETVSIATYVDTAASAPTLLKPPVAAGDGEDWLIVDDLVDRGTTMRVVRTLLPRAKAAVLYAKPQGRPLTDWCVRDFPQDSWIDFPWETAVPE